MSDPAVRVALLADTHGFLDSRIAEVVADCDVAIHAGDIGGADILFAMHPQREVIAIRGNNDDADHWSDTELDTLQNLPDETDVALPGGRLKVIHGDDGGSLEQRHRRYRRRYGDYQAVVYGHSHRQRVDQSQRPWLLNPGAAGRTRTYGGPGCLIPRCDPEGWQLEACQFEARSHRAKHSRARPIDPTAADGAND